MRRLTDYEMLDVTEYVLNVLGESLKSGDLELGEWIQRAKDEIHRRRRQYLVVGSSLESEETVLNKLKQHLFIEAGAATKASKGEEDE